MKSINYVIVELDQAYNNEVELSTGDSLIVNSTIESVSNINREATVKSSPDFVILKEGDKVIVHHNIFRLRNGIDGNVVPSNFHIEGNLYFVPFTEIFMYKRGDNEWNALMPFCFVEPIVKEKKEGFDLSAAESTYKGRLHRRGIIKYPNEDLQAQGIQQDDTVLFTKNSEYEFEIDGKLYYKMSTRDIVGAI